MTPNKNIHGNKINLKQHIVKDIKSISRLVCLQNSRRIISIAFIGLVFFNVNFIKAQYIKDAEVELPSPIVFEKQIVASVNYESVGVFDVNNDGVKDLVSGAFWYQGPSFEDRYAIGDPKRYGEYYDHFSTIPLDVNGDNQMDFVTGGWFGKELVWKENSGSEDEWQEHLIAKVGNIETTRAWDFDGDGLLEIVPNMPNNELVIFRLVTNTKGKGISEFSKHHIAENQGHGLGFGDINSDGRVDIIVPDGWYESPEKPFEHSWSFHPEFSLQTASIPIIVTDVNSDGLTDFIVGQGHDYGLYWYEQRPVKNSKEEKWVKHSIDPFNSQYHTMEWEDLDGDGKNELITGKRYRAHNGKDPGGKDPIGLYYYRWTGENFSKQFIDYGTYGEGKGTGVYFCVDDLNDDDRKDIVVAGKDGLVVYFNTPIKEE